MRTRRWIGAAMLVGATLGWLSPASADGGAYLDLDRTHYLPGQTARVEGYVSIPRAKQDLIERGPFYVFVVPPRTAVTEGRPIPAEAVRAGTVSIERDRGTIFEVRGSFVVPELTGRSYGLAVCNDPCTISGFREPLTGTISIVATAREGELLTEVSRLKRTDLEPASTGPQGRARERGDPRAAHGCRDRALGLGEQDPRVGVDRAAGATSRNPASAAARLVRHRVGPRTDHAGARGGAPAPTAARARRPRPDRLARTRGGRSGRPLSGGDPPRAWVAFGRGSTDRVPAGTRALDPGGCGGVRDRLDPVRP